MQKPTPGRIVRVIFNHERFDGLNEFPGIIVRVYDDDVIGVRALIDGRDEWLPQVGRKDKVFAAYEGAPRERLPRAVWCWPPREEPVIPVVIEEPLPIDVVRPTNPVVEGLKHDQVLIGSSILPARIDLGDRSLQLGELVSRAYERSGLTVEAWNDLPDEVREGLLQQELEAIKAGNA